MVRKAVGSDLDFSMVVLAIPAEEIHLQTLTEVTQGAQSKRAQHKPRPHLLEQLVLMVLELPHGGVVPSDDARGKSVTAGLPLEAWIFFFARFSSLWPGLPESSACRRADLLH